MTLLRYSSGGKPKSVEDRIGGGVIGFPLDPLLHPSQPLGGLVDVVTVGEVGECFEQLFEAFGAAEDSRGRVAGMASWRASCLPHSLILTHSSAFPLGCWSGTQSPCAAG